MQKFRKTRTLLFLCITILLLSVLGGTVIRHHSELHSTGPFPLHDEISARNKVLCENLPKSKESKIEITFKMRVRSLKLNQNAFQTSLENKGLRLELDQTGVPALVYMPLEGQLESLSIDRPVQLNKEIDVKILWSEEKHLVFQVGEQIKERSTNMNRSLACDDLKIGVGYDSSRWLDGQVEEFQYSIISSEPLLKIPAYLQGLLGGIFAFSISSLWLLKRTKGLSRKI